jgi:hypothetical protein
VRPSRMLKQSVSLSCSFDLFGLSGLFGCMRLTRWARQTGLVPYVQTREVLACQYSLPAASRGLPYHQLQLSPIQ